MPEEPTTPDAVELTRRAFAAANEGDFGALMSYFGPDSVFDVSSWGFGTYHGKLAIRRFLEDWIGSFDTYERVAQETLDLGNGVIYTAAVTQGVPSGSRADILLRGASVLVWTEGMIMQVTNYRDIDEGRAAAERLAEERG
jgi:ketosteroid isomerase-like protein